MGTAEATTEDAATDNISDKKNKKEKFSDSFTDHQRFLHIVLLQMMNQQAHTMSETNQSMRKAHKLINVISREQTWTSEK